MSNTIGDYVNLDNSTLPKNTPHDLVVDVYTLPSFDNGRAPERKRVRELISINSIVTPDTILFNKLNVRFKRIWDIRSATVMSLCSNEFLRLKTTNLDDSYLYYLLHSDYITNYLVNASGGSSGSHSRISPGDLLSIPISPPNIEEQKNIARLLSVLDDKIELNRKINAELEQMARTLYDYWFVQFDFPGASGKPYKSSGGPMKHSPELNRQIPEGWHALRLQGVLEFEKGTEPGAAAYSEVQNDEFSLPFYRVGDIAGKTSTYIDSSKFKPKIVQPHDVIVTFDGSVGRMGLGLDGAISGGLRHIYDKTGTMTSAGVYAIFDNEYITKTIERYATGSVILHASSSIPYLMIPYDQEVFAKFQKTIEPMFAKIIANRQQSQKLAELRDWLLPMLMNGQVRVG